MLPAGLLLQVRPRFPNPRFLEDKAKKPKKDVGTHVLLYSDRCIMCTRCVRFTREISGTSELAVFGRGYKEEIDVFPGKPINNPLSANVIDICPVGALLDKDFLFTQRVWFLKSTPSISPFTSGGENIEIHHTDGRIYRIKPRYNKDVNKWWISDETRYGFRFVHAEDRLMVPESGGAEISWEQATQLAEEKLRGAVKIGGSGSLVCIVSPFDATEEIFLQIKLARSIDPQCWLTMNPVRVDGMDQIFKNPANGQVTFTIKAEKAPNRKGAEKMFAHFGGNACSFVELEQKVSGGKIAAALLASADPFAATHVSNYRQTLEEIKTVVRCGIADRRGAVEKAELSLAAGTWAEKSGVYENFEGRIQPFAQAIAPIGDSRSAGQIFWDLLGNTGRFSAAGVRSMMVVAGLPEYGSIEEPSSRVHVEEMQFAEL